MLFKNKFYTIMVVPSATSRVKTIKVSGKLMNTVVSLVAVLTLGSGYFVYDYVSVKGQMSELERLRTETRSQRLKLNAFAQQIIDVEKEMNRLRKFDSVIRGVFDLDGTPTTSPSARAGGMGGSRNEALEANPELLEGKINSLSRQMEKDLDRLKGETSTREASLGQLVQFLQEKRSLMRATPSVWPVKGLLTSNFQRRVDPFTGRLERHMGLDIATNEGVPVIAPADGVVVKVDREAGLGRTLTIDHGFGFATRYGHHSKVVVADGQRVKRGQIIAYVGNTGRSTGPHLHYEISRNGVPVNPADFIMN